MKVFGICALLLLFVGCEDRSHVPQASTSAGPGLPEQAVAPSTRLKGSNVVSLVFSPDGTQVLSKNGNGPIQIWSVESGQSLTGAMTEALIAPVPRYDPQRIDNMPPVGADNFKILQDQIDALGERIRRLEQEQETGRR